MGLSRVVVRDYRCIDSLDVVLSGFNVIVGVNGVGKTSFLEAVTLVASVPSGFRDLLGRSVLEQVLGRRVRLDYYVRIGAQKSMVTAYFGSVRVEVELAANHRWLSVAERIPYARQLLDLAVSSASALYHEDEFYKLYIAAFQEDLERIWLGVVYSGKLKVSGEAKSGYQIISYDLLEKSWNIWGVVGEPKVFFIDERTRYSNRVADVIGEIIKKGLKKKFVNYLSDKLKRRVSDIELVKDKVFVEVPGNEKLTPIEFLGDGLAQYIAIAAIGFLMIKEAKGGILVLEEPELHMHPGLLRPLAELLVELPGRGVQVVLSTHSPELLRYISYAAEQRNLDNIAFFYFTRSAKGEVVVSEYRGLDEVLPELEYLAERLYAIA